MESPDDVVADLQAQLTNLYAIRSSGVLHRKIGGALEYTYRSDADLLRAIYDLERQLGIRSTSPASMVVHSHKGWNRRRDW